MNEFLILYILKTKSLNIYEIAKFIDKYFAPFLQLTSGAIIPVLNRLEKAQCVQSEKIMTDGGLKRSIYSITDQGEIAINTYLEQEISGAPQLVRREIEVLLTLIESPILTDEQKKLLRNKIVNALNTNIKLIEKSIKNSPMNIEFLNIELVCQEARLRHVQEIVNDN